MRQPVTASEDYLARLCRRAFLHLWRYPNLFKNEGQKGTGDGKGLCDLCVVFGQDIFIFSDKHCELRAGPKLELAWRRWYKRAVLKSGWQVLSAENWIRRFPDRVFTDRACQRPVPIAWPRDPKIHRILTVRGAAQASQATWGGRGSVMTSNGSFEEAANHPLRLGAIDADGRMFHIFDEVAFDAVLQTLDTIADFRDYIAKREVCFPSTRACGRARSSPSRSRTWVSTTAFSTSGGRETPTYQGRPRGGIPIAEELVPYLRTAVSTSPSDWLFPKPDGTPQPATVDLVSILRSALRKAHIVTGYVHKCRRRGCGHQEESIDGKERCCPKCNMKLWPVGKVVRLRFHDTRHTTASLLMMFGANPAAVQRILRHTDIRVTMDVYSHLAPGYLRSEIDRLSFRPKPPPPAEDPAPISAAATASDPALPGPLTSPVLQSAGDATFSPTAPTGKSELSPALQLVGVTGFEPATSCSQSRRATNCATPRRSGP
jgi:hypothetical protein